MDFVAVLVAALVGYVLGFIWYHPSVFGKKWMKLAGVKKMKPSAGPIVLGLISTFVMAFVLAMLLTYMKATTLMDGLFGGFLVWLGFIATVTLGSVLWENKSVNLYVLNNAYSLLQLLVMGAILVSM